MPTDVRIEDWFFYFNGTYASDGNMWKRYGTYVLCGTVYGHPRIADGSRVSTSKIASVHVGHVSEYAYEKCVRTQNTNYRLGKQLEELDEYWLVDMDAQPGAVVSDLTQDMIDDLQYNMDTAPWRKQS